MKKFIIIPLFILCSCISACSPSTETVITQEDYDILLEELNFLESVNTALENDLEEQAEEYEGYIESLKDERNSYDEYSLELEKQVEYYENLAKQYNLPTYEESLNQ